MGVAIRPGPASIEGLAWLARVGPAPIEAWGCAMGWGRTAAFSHAQRLAREGRIERLPMARGEGSLLIATRVGVRVAGVPVKSALTPAPTWWAHSSACAWVAAWLTARGRGMEGCRDVLEDPTWTAKIRWSDWNGFHTSGHRPDLAVTRDGARVPIEVELARKSVERLKAILGLHARWRAARKTGGVIYVCADQAGCARVREIATSRDRLEDRPRRRSARRTV